MILMKPDYIVSIAKKTEKEKIQSFIDNCWKKNHSLVMSSELFDFQHKNSITGEYNFVLAKDTERKEDDIIALMGFIPTYQYDRSLESNGDYWGAIWKKRDDVKDERFKSSGFDVYQRIYEETNFHSYAAIGVSKIALKIYKFWGCKIGYLNHYYILNDKIKNFVIAGNVNQSDFSLHEDIEGDFSWKLSEIDENEISSLNITPYYKPYKSINYIINRYAKHPIYKYKFLGIYKNDAIVSLLVIRFMEVNGAKSIRVVDVLGQLQGLLYHQFISYLHATGAEYVDILNYGIDADIFTQMGFKKLDLDGNLIIPNYFEPFEQRNVKIDIAWKADYENYVAFKGDSDQDRPNIL